MNTNRREFESAIISDVRVAIIVLPSLTDRRVCSRRAAMSAQEQSDETTKLEMLGKRGGGTIGHEHGTGQDRSGGMSLEAH